MPYIKQQYRTELDPLIEELSKKIVQLDSKTFSGNMNYTFYKIMQNVSKRCDKGACYDTYNSLMGMMDSCSKEFYRREVAPYEDLKIKENGDVK